MSFAVNGWISFEFNPSYFNSPLYEFIVPIGKKFVPGVLWTNSLKITLYAVDPKNLFYQIIKFLVFIWTVFYHYLRNIDPNLYNFKAFSIWLTKYTIEMVLTPWLLPNFQSIGLKMLLVILKMSDE